MNQLELEPFLAQFQPTLQLKLRDMAARPDIVALVAYGDAAALKAAAFTETPQAWPESTVSVYCKRPLRPADEPDEPPVPKSRTMQALDLIAEGASVRDAARQVCVDPAAVYRALQRREDKTVCPCCGQVLREGFTIDRSVLKKR